MKFNVKAFGMTCGLFWVIGSVLFTSRIIRFEGVAEQVVLPGVGYRDFIISPAGSLLGLFWGFVFGLLGGGLFALLYNALLPKTVGRSRKSPGVRNNTKDKEGVVYPVQDVNKKVQFQRKNSGRMK